MYRMGGVALTGAFVYTAADVANDALTYFKLRALAMESAEGHLALGQRLGSSLTPGPWYDASVSFTHGGHIASTTFPVHGDKGSSDIVVRAVRRTYPLGTLLYNAAGPGEWKVLACEALLPPPGGGLPQPMPLLQPPELPENTAGGATHGCAPCKEAGPTRA